MFFSIIIPVYNRPQEMRELLDSLDQQSSKNFELLVVEDGSNLDSEEVVKEYADRIEIQYIKKPNTGRSDTRNVGMSKARGDYFLFFDSDCILPPFYIEELQKNLKHSFEDVYGGPDKAMDNFLPLQKAINYAMTSFLTTGGIRGGKKKSLEKFKPRSFNMGFSKKVYEKVGGFKDMFGEDIDLSLRMEKAGFALGHFPDLYVFHKRRLSFKKFYHQIKNFGKARVQLFKLYPYSLKWVHLLPAAFIIAEIFLVISTFFLPLWVLLFFPFLWLILWVDAFCKTKSIQTAAMSVYAAMIQIHAYGIGFIYEFMRIIICKKSFLQGEELAKIYNK